MKCAIWISVMLSFIVLLVDLPAVRSQALLTIELSTASTLRHSISVVGSVHYPVTSMDSSMTSLWPFVNTFTYICQPGIYGDIDWSLTRGLVMGVACQPAEFDFSPPLLLAVQFWKDGVWTRVMLPRAIDLIYMVPNDLVDGSVWMLSRKSLWRLDMNDTWSNHSHACGYCGMQLFHWNNSVQLACSCGSLTTIYTLGASGVFGVVNATRTKWVTDQNGTCTLLAMRSDGSIQLYCQSPVYGTRMYAYSQPVANGTVHVDHTGPYTNAYLNVSSQLVQLPFAYVYSQSRLLIEGLPSHFMWYKGNGWITWNGSAFVVSNVWVCGQFGLCNEQDNPTYDLALQITRYNENAPYQIPFMHWKNVPSHCIWVDMASPTLSIACNGTISETIYMGDTRILYAAALWSDPSTVFITTGAGANQSCFLWIWSETTPIRCAHLPAQISNWPLQSLPYTRYMESGTFIWFLGNTYSGVCVMLLERISGRLSSSCLPYSEAVLGSSESFTDFGLMPNGVVWFTSGWLYYAFSPLPFLSFYTVTSNTNKTSGTLLEQWAGLVPTPLSNLESVLQNVRPATDSQATPAYPTLLLQAGTFPDVVNIPSSTAAVAWSVQAIGDQCISRIDCSTWVEAHGSPPSVYWSGGDKSATSNRLLSWTAFGMELAAPSLWLPPLNTLAVGITVDFSGNAPFQQVQVAMHRVQVTGTLSITDGWLASVDVLAWSNAIVSLVRTRVLVETIRITTSSITFQAGTWIVSNDWTMDRSVWETQLGWAGQVGGTLQLANGSQLLLSGASTLSASQQTDLVDSQIRLTGASVLQTIGSVDIATTSLFQSSSSSSSSSSTSSSSSNHTMISMYLDGTSTWNSSDQHADYAYGLLALEPGANVLSSNLAAAVGPPVVVRATPAYPIPFVAYAPATTTVSVQRWFPPLTLTLWDTFMNPVSILLMSGPPPPPVYHGTPWIIEPVVTWKRVNGTWVGTMNFDSSILQLASLEVSTMPVPTWSWTLPGTAYVATVTPSSFVYAVQGRPCLPGEWRDALLGECRVCATGTIQPSANQTSCVACGAGASTNDARTACLCSVGYAWWPDQQSCVACNEGFQCNTTGMMASSMQLASGYWTTIDLFPQAIPCPMVGRSCAGGNYSATPCSNGYQGPLCGVCTEGFYLLGQSWTDVKGVDTGGSCIPCDSATNIARFVIVVLLVALVGVGACAAIFYHMCVADKADVGPEEKIEEEGEEEDAAAAAVHEASNAPPSGKAESICVVPVIGKTDEAFERIEKLSKQNSFHLKSHSNPKNSTNLEIPSSSPIASVMEEEEEIGLGLELELEKEKEKENEKEEKDKKAKEKEEKAAQNHSPTVPSRWRRAVRVLFQRRNLVALSLFVGFVQVAAVLQTQYSIPWGAVVYDSLGWLRLSWIDVQQVFAVSCVQSNLVYSTIMCTTCFSILGLLGVIGLVYVAVGGVQRCRGFDDHWRKSRRDLVVRVGTQLAVWTHPLITGYASAWFHCTRIGDTWWLVADFRTECYTPYYWSWASVAILLLVLVSAGWPLTLWFYLRSKHDRLANALTQRRTGHLYRQYKPAFYWWEVTEIVRKMLLTSLLGVFGANTQVQLVLGLLVSILAHLVHATYRPFRLEVHHRLQHALLGVTWLALLLGLLLQLQSVSDAQALIVGVIVVMLHYTVIVLVMVVIFGKVWKLTQKPIVYEVEMVVVPTSPRSKDPLHEVANPLAEPALT